jgi:hypothetical protein
MTPLKSRALRMRVSGSAFAEERLGAKLLVSTNFEDGYKAFLVSAYNFTLLF